MSKRKKAKRHSQDFAVSSEQRSPHSKHAHVNGAVVMVILAMSVIGLGAFINFSSPGMTRVSTSSARASAMPVATPEYAANKPAKEYIHANGKLLALSEPVNAAPTDLAVWRLSTGTWWVLDQDGSNTTQAFGLSTDLPAPGDYDGDGKTDFCVYRPTEGNWYLLQSGSGNTLAVHTFGNNGDKPVPADYNGDGKTELALYRV